MSQGDHVSQPEFAQFINAIKNGDTEKVELIIKKSHPEIVNKMDTAFNQPPIYSAALAKSDQASAEMIKLLIRHGANYRFKDSLDQTVLFYVFRQGKELCAEILLSQGLNIDQADSNGQTPIFYAVGENRLQIVKKYATKDRVNHVDNLAGQTPIYYAARNGHLQMCKLLMEKGADITHGDHNNKTAVDFARKSKYFEVSQYLVSELKRVKETHKISMASQSIEESNLEKKKKREELKPIRQTYKIVFLDQRGANRDLTEEDVRQMCRQHPELQKYLANPESIPQELIDRSNGDLWQKTAMKILAQCFKLKGSYWFQQSVDPVKFNILDYFDIIRKPMDLGTVRKKVMHNSYANVEEFISEMKLIWQNCYKYNGQSHDISKCAKELEINFQEYCKSYGLEKYMRAQNQ